MVGFEEDIGSLISRALPGENNDNALCLERTANIVREEMFNESSSATGSATQSCQKGSVPQALLSLVSMILEGPDAKRPVNWKAKSSCANISAASEIQQCEARTQKRRVHSVHQESRDPIAGIHRCDAACKNTEKRSNRQTACSRHVDFL